MYVDNFYDIISGQNVSGLLNGTTQTKTCDLTADLEAKVQTQENQINNLKQLLQYNGIGIV